jgi:transcriptional regulator with XRE-family HTH domain
MLGITQQQLSDRLGITFQQVQKYESGGNRISASRLWEISAALDSSIEYFFQGLEDQAPAASEVQGDILRDKEAIALVSAYFAMPVVQRQRLFDLARALGAEPAAKATEAA